MPKKGLLSFLRVEFSIEARPSILLTQAVALPRGTMQSLTCQATDKVKGSPNRFG